MRHFILIFILLSLACNSSRNENLSTTEEERKETKRIEDNNQEVKRRKDLEKLVVLTPNLKRYDSLVKKTGLPKGLFVFCDAWGMKYNIDVFTNNNNKKTIYFKIDSSGRDDIKGEADKQYLSDHYSDWLNRFFLDSSYIAACFFWSEGDKDDRYYGRSFYIVSLMREDFPVIRIDEPLQEFLGQNSLNVSTEQKGSKLFIKSSPRQVFACQ